MVVATAGFKGETPGRRFLREFARSWVAVAATVVLLLILLLAALAPWIAPTNPYDLLSVSIMDNQQPPGSRSMAGTVTFWLGTDGLGRDLLSAILYGLRISLVVGLSSTIIAIIVGTAMGLTAGYFGGRVDTAIMRFVDLQLSFPAILIALLLVAILGQGVEKIIIALVAVQWAYYARTARASALIERQREYVEAARSQALGDWRVIFQHVLPNCLAPIIVVGTVQSANAILLEATLSFLGLGLPPTEPSLGLLIANGFDFLMSGRYWVSVFPGIALFVLICAINLVGDQMRDVLNPRLRT
jgi:peptide/nickel transport system permease protein